MLPFNAMRLRQEAAVGPFAFDASHYQSDRLTLSNSNKTAARTTGGGATPGLARATQSRSSGKLYVEFLAVNVAGGLLAAGLCNASMDVSTGGTLFLGESSNGWAYWADGSKWFNNAVQAGWGATWSATDVVQIAWDVSNGTLWFGFNNTWQGVAADPVAGTGHAYNGVTGTLYPVADCYGSGASITVRPVADNSYSPPSGFTAWA